VNVTLPVAELLPLAALTVAVNTVVPAAAMLAGLAVTTVAVPTTGATTVTTADPAELLKLPVAV
jgi:hypothetical protein